jgi:transcriptional regulator with GAF, ATPase, and Fis domain
MLTQFEGIIGQSAAMQNVFRWVSKISEGDSTILINGETGTGKGLIARAIHHHSDRRDKPFVQINCGAIPENLLESELFGHVRGAFTGATASKPGKFELADGGTIFLDEIGDMSPDLQVKVLRVLEEKVFEPVGGANSVGVDVRVIAATHRDLEKEVSEGNFREDLFYRLYVIPIKLPALRERRSDIPLLVKHYLQHFNAIKNRTLHAVDPEALNCLMNYPWPGNVRELRNLVERLVVLKGEGNITPDDLPAKIACPKTQPRPSGVEISREGICLNTAVSEYEKALIYKSLQESKWVKKKAAQLLHIKRTTLVEKIKRYQLQQCA